MTSSDSRMLGGGRCLIIGEVGLAHDGSLGYAHAFIDEVAAAGADGLVRLIESETGRLVQEISPAPITSADSVQPEFAAVESVTAGEPETSPESLASDSELVELIVQPSEINLSTESAYSQLVVTGRRADGASIDVTRLATTTGFTRCSNAWDQRSGTSSGSHCRPRQ